MAEITKIDFTLQEVAELLAKKHGLVEGRWMLGFEFGLLAANMGPSSSEVKPSAVIQINRLNLVKMPVDTPADTPLTFDAASLSPDATSKMPVPKAKAKAKTGR